MSEPVYCKNCKWIELGEYAQRAWCNHPSVKITTISRDPVYGEKIKYEYIALKGGRLGPNSYDPYIKNADLSCKDFEEKFFVKLWKLIIYS